MRISVTALDQYAYYLSSDLSISDYIQRLRRKEPPSAAMQRGIDFHTVIENLALRKVPPPVEYTFSFEVEAEMLRPNLVESVCLGKLEVCGEQVVVSGRLDYIRGNTGGDYKTTAAAINLENYASAMQWRTYLWLNQSLSHFQYDVFRIIPEKSKPKHSRIVEYRTITFNKYNDMFDDVNKALSDYVVFLKGLERAGKISFDVNGRIV